LTVSFLAVENKSLNGFIFLQQMDRKNISNISEGMILAQAKRQKINRNLFGLHKPVFATKKKLQKEKENLLLQ
jgi:hypothetical protein